MWLHWNTLTFTVTWDIFFHFIACLYFSTMLILWVRKYECGVLEIIRDKKILPSHSSSTRDLRLLYLWFPKPHTHISYSQYFYNANPICFFGFFSVKMMWAKMWRKQLKLLWLMSYLVDRQMAIRHVCNKFVGSLQSS